MFSCTTQWRTHNKNYRRDQQRLSDKNSSFFPWLHYTCSDFSPVFLSVLPSEPLTFPSYINDLQPPGNLWDMIASLESHRPLQNNSWNPLTPCIKLAYGPNNNISRILLQSPSTLLSLCCLWTSWFLDSELAIYLIFCRVQGDCRCWEDGLCSLK